MGKLLWGIPMTVSIQPLIQRAIAHHIDFEKAYVFLFGSRASGHEKSSSDYDIGIYTGNPVPLATIAKIKDELEDHPIPVDVDIVDFSTVSSEFKRIALKEIQLWNQPRTNLKLI